MTRVMAARRIGLALLGGAGLTMLAGCLARTAVDVVTLPVRAAGQTADWLTTSQEESDRNYGRKMRKQEAREGRALRRRQKEEERAARRARDED